MTPPLSRRSLALVLSILAGACSSAPGPSAPSPAGLTAVTAPRPGSTGAEILAQDVRLRVGLLAHDSMRGREVGSSEIRGAARYLAEEMARLGLQPAGEGGTYFQPVPLERTRTRVQVNLSAGGAARDLSAAELLLVSGLGGLPPTASQSGEGSVLFAGYLFDPAVTQEITFEQSNGAAVVLRMGAPAGVDESQVPPRMAVASFFSPGSIAAAVLLVVEGDLVEFWDYAADMASKGAVALPQPATPAEGPPVFLISAEAAERLLGGPLENARQPRLDLGRIAYRLETTVEQFEDVNVVAVLPGRDPARSHEYMSLGAHYDHVGVGAAVNGDSIFNGADDNASGTTALLEVAELLAHRLAAERPARSVLFNWHAAEESGLLGSEYFTDNPTIPRDNIVAHINMDMVGRNSPDSVQLVGSKRLSTEFGRWVELVNSRLARPFVLDYTLDAPGHPEMIYCRSDHWNFARFGVPSVMISSGLHDDYHKPSDQAERLDADKVTHVAQFAAALTDYVVGQPARPRVDQPVPPLGAPCG